MRPKQKTRRGFSAVNLDRTALPNQNMKFGENASVRVPFLSTCRAVCWYFSWSCSKHIRDHQRSHNPLVAFLNWERLGKIGVPWTEKSCHRRTNQGPLGVVWILASCDGLGGWWRLQVLHPWPSETRHTFQPESKMFQDVSSLSLTECLLESRDMG